MSTELPDGGVVLLDLSSELYFGLNEVGASVWSGIQAGEDFAGLVTRVCSEFDVERSVAEADLHALITELLERELVSEVSEV